MHCVRLGCHVVIGVGRLVVGFQRAYVIQVSSRCCSPTFILSSSSQTVAIIIACCTSRKRVIRGVVFADSVGTAIHMPLSLGPTTSSCSGVSPFPVPCVGRFKMVPGSLACVLPKRHDPENLLTRLHCCTQFCVLLQFEHVLSSVNAPARRRSSFSSSHRPNLSLCMPRHCLMLPSAGTS